MVYGGRHMATVKVLRAAVIAMMTAALSLSTAQFGWADASTNITVSGVVTLDGEPVAGVRVCDYIGACTTSATDGSYTVEVLPDTNPMAYPYPCLVVYPGNEDQRTRFAPVTFNERSRACVLAVAGVPGGSVVKDVALTSFAQDTGRIIDQKGRPIVGASVVGGLYQKTVTDARGRFTTRIGVYHYDGGSLVISAPGYRDAYIYHHTGGVDFGDIVMAPTGDAEQFTLTGTVTNAKGVPVAGAYVCEVDMWCAVTNKKGRYFITLDSAAQKGHWHFRVSNPNNTSWVERDLPFTWYSNFGRADYTLPQLSSTKPVIAGEAKVGSTLTADAGVWAPVPVKLTYRWYANGKRIRGAASSVLVLKQAQKGKRITVKVTGTKKGYPTVSRVSVPTKKVAR